MQDPAFDQFAAGERLPGGFDAILGRDADNLLREIDAERIDSARRSPTLRVRPGVPANDPLWRPDDEDHERRYLRGDFDDPHETQPDTEGAAALPLFGGPALAGEYPDAAEAGAGRRATSKAWVREVVETGLLALLVFLAVRASFQNFKVDGHSMDPTLENGQLIIVNKLIYSEMNVEKLSNFLPFINTGNSSTRALFHGPQRGDIVVLVDPRRSNQDLIKRVIGLPGETVEVADGKVYINDQLLLEPYIKTPWHDTKAKQTIPADEYFVMGDNRDNSLDSRSIGPVAKQLIIGKAMLSYWPSSQFGFAPNEEGTLSAKDAAPKLTTTRIGDK